MGGHLHVMYEVDGRAKRQNLLRALREEDDEERVLVQEIFSSKECTRVATRKVKTERGIHFCCSVEDGFIIGTRDGRLYFERRARD
mmetsp:Transcript_26721/g.64767  ORF Transcript_26721/g.64767 Transcript_26721/m.64767 type:complete len:86 (+) Transcript_26721:1005-1262(+)